MSITFLNDSTFEARSCSTSLKGRWTGDIDNEFIIVYRSCVTRDTGCVRNQKDTMVIYECR